MHHRKRIIQKIAMENEIDVLRVLLGTPPEINKYPEIYE